MSNKSSSRLFSTLASIEREDESATKRRRQSNLHSLHQSREASNQTKINSILLELRILAQRCTPTEEEIGTASSSASAAAIIEVDAILEKLLVARRDLMGQQRLLDTNIDDGTSFSVSDEENSNDLEENTAVNYAEFIRSHQASTMTNTVDEEDEDNDDGLTKHMQSEHASLRNHWKIVLNKLHSNLTLHSGMSANHSKFQSKAVDVSFWEQVQSGVHHERFQNQSTNTTDIGESHSSRLQFDDSKLYQQMLKDFISSSRSITSSSANHRGGGLDPAQDAAERLKRAMRKKTGGNGDIDLTSLLIEEEEYSVTKKKKATTATGATAASVDRRASKGRKIRYTVHPKLVNFTFPLSRPESIISDDVLFKSLFGGVGNFR